MTKNADRALLPAGLRDILPPDAAFEARVAERIVARFAAHGYERVKPPLIEFESSLLGNDNGGELAAQTFRVMDPVSQRMLAVRSDMTPQIARIATSRLEGEPRPLRLAYSGQVLRVKGSQLRPERQFGQAGIELIGASEPHADAEIIGLAAEALAELVPGISVDLSLPTLVPALCAELGLDKDAVMELRRALDHKDAAGVAALGGKAATLFGAMLSAAGPAERALATLASLGLPGQAARELEKLATVVACVRADAPTVQLTVDPVENRGFEYHSGVTFTIFAQGHGFELGRGGRYLAGEKNEPSVGVTLFLDSILRAASIGEPVRRIYLPFGTKRAAGDEMRKAGFVTLAGLAPVADSVSEAKRLKCAYWLDKGQAVKL
jgi:ATP phosphoribosyltransferase regulatory subunit